MRSSRAEFQDLASWDREHRIQGWSQ
jgi:hypothetical protein